MTTPSRLSELDAFRGIAAMSVLLAHYTTVYQTIYGNHDVLIYFQHGGLGINLFFMISGFVIYLSLGKAKTSLDFIVGRFSRLYPTYWIAIGLTFTIVALFGLPGQAVSLRNALINLTMIEPWFNVPYVDGVYWTLAVELAFYAIMLILYKNNLLKRIDVLAVGWLAVIYSTRILCYFLNVKLPFMLMATILFWWGQFFIAGIMFYKIKNKQSSYYHHIIIAVCFIFSITSMVTIGELIINSIYFILFYLFCYDKLKFITIKPLLFLGMISYPLYLIHCNIGSIVIFNLNNLHVNPNISALIALAVALLLAWLIHISVEKPAMQLIRTKYRALMERKAAMPVMVLASPGAEVLPAGKKEVLPEG